MNSTKKIPNQNSRSKVEPYLNKIIIALDKNEINDLNNIDCNENQLNEKQNDQMKENKENINNYLNLKENLNVNMKQSLSQVENLHNSDTKRSTKTARIIQDSESEASNIEHESINIYNIINYKFR